MRAIAVLMLIGLLSIQGCAFLVLGAVAGAAAGTSYTVLGIASKTFTDEYDTVLAAVRQALVTLDIKTGNEKQAEDGGKVVKTEIEAFARDLSISISVERLTDKATRVVVDASRKYVIKDSATAGEIINQAALILQKKS
jgi:hypothetical protein